MQAIRQRYSLGSTGYTYYDLTNHKSGDNNTNNNFYVSAIGSYTGPKLLQRRTSDGTIRETDQNMSWDAPSPYNDNDILAVTIPLDQIWKFWGRYNQIKSFRFSFSTQMPNIQEIYLRGNWMSLGKFDLSGCTKLRFLDTSMNFINDIYLPPLDNPNNNFDYAYMGSYYGHSDGVSIPYIVINKIMEYAYHSSAIGTLGTGAGNGHITYNGVNYHELLVAKGWKVSHLSHQNGLTISSGAQTVSSPVMSSTFDWTVEIPSTATWLSCDTSLQTASNSPKNIFFNVTANTTGAPRQTTISINKWKNAISGGSSGEYHYEAKMLITQNG